MIRAMVLEKKIIIIKEDVSDVSIIIQTLISMMLPFKWSFNVITNLPLDMIDALESIHPFIIGV